MDDRLSATHAPQAQKPLFGLAARILLLTVCFVLLAEVAIYIPSIANFRNTWLRTRLSSAYTAALVLDAAPEGMVPKSLKLAILNNVDARMIVLKRHDSRRMLAASDAPPTIDEWEDLREFSVGGSITAAFRALAAPEGRVIDIRGDAPDGADYVEITLDEAPLKAAMRAYSINILKLSLIISLIVASLAVAALNILVLAPVRRLTGNVIAFAAAPEDASRLIKPSGAQHEIGVAEEALAAMETALARELSEKKHLAALGLAVAKINHDLRNMLSSAQLISDRLAAASDPLVVRLAPKLVATLDRAIAFCGATLAYGGSVDETPKFSRVSLRPLADEALETAVLSARRPIETQNAMSEDVVIEADRDQLFRVLHNLCRNAVEALNCSAIRLQPAVRISAIVVANEAVIMVSDTGPGLPPVAREKLFSAFQGSVRPGGSGLGLAIAADLVRAHGGTIRHVVSTDPHWPGAMFEIRLPLWR